MGGYESTWLDKADMTGYGWIWMDMGGYGWIWLDKADMNGYGWIWVA